MHLEVSGQPGQRVNLLGNLGIVRGALEAGVQFFSCYPGTPSSEVGDTFAVIAKEEGIVFEYSVNEKIAVEIAFAAALTGARSMCSMKHLGLNAAGDPISTMPYVGVEGGMVIVSAGDPSAITSPNEQDQRYFGKMFFYPLFDPSNPDEARLMTRFAFDLSEQCRLPVIIRPTTRVCHSSGPVTLGERVSKRNQVNYVKSPERHVPIPVNARRMRKELTHRFQKAEDLLARSGFFKRRGQGTLGIVASGMGYNLAQTILQKLNLERKVVLQQIGAYPIPAKILSEFLDQVDQVLVVEELTPFVEEELMIRAQLDQKVVKILGKKSGHLPFEFEYSLELVEDAVRNFVGMSARPKRAVKSLDLPARPPVLCAGCPHRTSYYLARKVFGKKTVYCNDIGCYTLGYGKPLEVCDMLLCMGSSISQASGVSRMTGERVVAFIGDSTFFHSGLPALANALQANDKITLMILDNDVTAMTGFQPSLSTVAKDNDRQFSGFSIEAAVRGLGVKEVFSVDPFDEEATVTALKLAKQGRGVNVVVAHSPCVVHQARQRPTHHPDYWIDEERCNRCTLCVRALGCPAIFVTNDTYHIDRELCDGCDLCARVCNRGAIRKDRRSNRYDKTDPHPVCRDRGAGSTDGSTPVL